MRDVERVRYGSQKFAGCNGLLAFERTAGSCAHDKGKYQQNGSDVIETVGNVGPVAADVRHDENCGKNKRCPEETIFAHVDSFAGAIEQQTSEKREEQTCEANVNLVGRQTEAPYHGVRNIGSPFKQAEDVDVKSKQHGQHCRQAYKNREYDYVESAYDGGV